jgi:hypothetical protein
MILNYHILLYISSDGLTCLVSKGNKKKPSEKIKMKRVNHEKNEKEIVHVSSDDGQYEDAILDVQVLSVKMLF